MSWPAKMDLTPQRGAFSRVLNRLARNTKIVFSPQRGGFSWALCLHDYFRDSIFAWRAQHLRTPYGHLKGWSAAGYFYLTPPHGAVERWKPMVPSTHCPVGRSPSLGPRWKISLICRGNQQSYISLLAPSMEQSWKNCSSELFLINVVGNQQRSCSRRTAPITVASPTWSLHQER